MATVLGCELGDRAPLTHDEQVRQRDDPVNVISRHRLQSGVDLADGAHGKLLKRQTKAESCNLRFPQFLVLPGVERIS